MEYSKLDALPPEAFSNPETFRTEFDRIQSQYAREQYEKGLKISREAKEVYITGGSTWGADLMSGAHVTSYEGIGYHSCTADLLRGFLAGPAPLVVYRRRGPAGGTEIKPRT